MVRHQEAEGGRQTWFWTSSGWESSTAQTPHPQHRPQQHICSQCSWVLLQPHVLIWEMIRLGKKSTSLTYSSSLPSRAILLHKRYEGRYGVGTLWGLRIALAAMSCKTRATGDNRRREAESHCSLCPWHTVERRNRVDRYLALLWECRGKSKKSIS